MSQKNIFSSDHNDKTGIMKAALYLLLVSISASGMASEVFRCSEPKGISMWSLNDHKIGTDRYTGVQPVVIVEDKEMTIVWGDTKLSGGTERVWKAVIFNRSAEAISAAALDTGASGSAAMLFTIDRKRGYLYLSSHKDSAALNASGASTFVSKCAI